MQLPLAQLELNRTARRKSTHGLRFVAPGLCAAVLLLVWFFMTIGGASANEMANFAGSFVSKTVLAYLVFVGCVLAPLFASGVIATEKQERSLGILLLTNIRGGDLVIAKGATIFLQVELLALGCLPLQAIASFLGGLTLKMLISQQISTAFLCMVTTALGLLCSTLAWRAIDAFFMTVGMVVAWLILASSIDTVVLESAGFGTASGLTLLIHTAYPDLAFGAVWRNGLYSLVPTLLAVSLVWVRLPRMTDDAGVRRRSARGRPRYSSWLDGIRYLRLNPVDRLYAANAAGVGGALYRWPWWPLVVLLTVILMVVPGGFGALLVVMLIVYDAASCITAVRQNGGADLLYLTEAAGHHLARGIHRTHLRRSLLFLPAMIAANVWSYIVMYGLFLAHELTPFDLGIAAACLIISLVGTWVSLYAYASLGCVASTWRGNPAMLTFKAMLALFGVYILSGVFSGFISMAFFMTTSGRQAMTGPANPGIWTLIMQTAISVAFALVMLAFGRSWYSSFGQKLSRRWRCGVET